MRTHLLAWAMGCCLSLLCAGQAAVQGASAPNIVLIMTDDMGYGDIGPFGSMKNRTPNLDRMAQQGLKFTSFYAAPVCSVSRAQVITGCYGVRVSIPSVFFPGHTNGINAAEHTVAELLKQRGYATLCVGKWHLGDQPEFLPTRHGFDHYFGIPYSNDMHRKSTATGKIVVPLLRDEQVIELLDGEGQDGITERYTEEAVKFIREHQARPFFLYLPHTAVHVPIHPGAKFRGKSRNGTYGDWVEEVDWSVGRVLDILRELKLEQRTLVMFTSDNGPWLDRGKDAGEAGPLRGGKGSTWEGGVRVPALAWWPGKVSAGAVCDAVAGNIDFLPTFVALAGGTVPEDRKIDGRDFSGLLFGTRKTAPRDAHFYYRGYKLEAVRSGSWKLALSPQVAGMSSPGGVAAPGLRLYHLESDIGEQTNVATEHPDVVKRLQELAAQMTAELGDGRAGPAVRPAGTVESSRFLYPSEAPVTKQANAKKDRANSVSLDALKIGDALASDAAPDVKGQTFTITCEVEPRSSNGVIVAHGGSAAGYALHLEEGRLVFTVRTGVQNVVSIKGAEPLVGRAAVEASLGANGTMKLVANNKTIAAGKAARLLPRQPAEKFCVGHDDGAPVIAYQGRQRFEGEIKSLKLAVGSVEKLQ